MKIAHLMVSWGASAELSVVYGTACSSSLEHSDATRATNPCMGAQIRIGISLLVLPFLAMSVPEITVNYAFFRHVDLIL